MASAKLVQALATGKVVIQKAPRISGEVRLMFYPLLNRTTGKTDQPAPITLADWSAVNPLKRSDVTLENLRHSNLEDLVRKQAIVIL
jgi:hypothetical protein